MPVRFEVSGDALVETFEIQPEFASAGMQVQTGYYDKFVFEPVAIPQGFYVEELDAY
jgi:hypothetical protein